MRKTLKRENIKTVTETLLNYGTAIEIGIHPLNINAAKAGDIDIIKYAQNHELDIKKEGKEILKNAVTSNQLEMVKYLKNQGADITIDNNFLIRESIRRGYLEMTEYLHQNGANPKENYLETLMHINEKQAKKTIEYLLNLLSLKELREIQKRVNEGYKPLYPQVTKFIREKKENIIKDIKADTEIIEQ